MAFLLVWYGTSSFSQILPKSRIAAWLPYLCLLWGRLYRCCLVLETCSFSRMNIHVNEWRSQLMSEGYVLCRHFRHFSFYFFLCLLVSNDLKCSTHLCIWSSRVLRVFTSKKLDGIIHVQSFDVSSASLTTFLWSFFCLCNFSWLLFYLLALL